MPQSLQSTYRWSGVSDVVAYTTTSVQSAVFGANTHEVRIVCSSAAWINIAQSPTAAATDNNGIYLPANVVEYFHVSPGQRVAVIQDTAGGNMSVAEMTR